MRSRDPLLDFVKGILVVVMLYYHCLDYFSNGSVTYKYIRFVTGSFVMMSGFMVAYIYGEQQKYSFHKKLIRLLERGMKILLLCLVLNMAKDIMLAGPGMNIIQGINHQILNIYNYSLLGDDTQISFHILVPIGYTLIVSALLMLVTNNNNKIINAVIIISGLLCLFQYNDMKGGYHLRYLNLGMIGYLLGQKGRYILEYVNRKFRHVAVSYIMYLLYISKYLVNYYIYILVVIVNLAGIASIGSFVARKGMVAGWVNVLGKYSLPAYIFQIFSLQVLRKLFLSISHEANIYLVFLALLVLMVMVVILVDVLRKRSRIVDNTYKIIFC